MQEQIAFGFKTKSEAALLACTGALDGVFKTHQPSVRDNELSGLGTIIYICKRKGKYGLNCQALCDVDCKFLDLHILAQHPTVLPLKAVPCIQDGMYLWIFHRAVGNTPVSYFNGHYI